MSFIHSKIRGKRSPRYGLIASALILEISEITFKIAETKEDVALSPSNFLIKHKRIDVEYALARSGVYRTNIFINFTASSRSLASLLCSSCDIKETINCLR